MGCSEFRTTCTRPSLPKFLASALPNMVPMDAGEMYGMGCRLSQPVARIRPCR